MVPRSGASRGDATPASAWSLRRCYSRIRLLLVLGPDSGGRRGSGGRPGGRGWGKISVLVSKFGSLEVGDGPEVGKREVGDGGACKVLQFVRTLLQE
jgi:hypothetical protein